MAKQKTTDERAAGRESRLGRPPLPRDRARSERVVSFVTPVELDTLRELADSRETSVSALIREWPLTEDVEIPNPFAAPPE